ncbi:MAG TPA: hypothetical protein VFZ23_16695, partial [Pyrinomonadaceae bacterium]
QVACGREDGLISALWPTLSPGENNLTQKIKLSARHAPKNTATIDLSKLFVPVAALNLSLM